MNNLLRTTCKGFVSRKIHKWRKFTFYKRFTWGVANLSYFRANGRLNMQQIARKAIVCWKGIYMVFESERWKRSTFHIAALLAVFAVALLMLCTPKHAFATQYAYFDSSTNVLTFTNTSDVHADGSGSGSITWFTIPTGGTFPSWRGAGTYEQIHRIDFDDTCAATPITSDNMASWFTLLPNLTEVDNADRLDVSSATDMSMMFYQDPQLRTINGLSSWRPSSATTILGLFGGDTALTSLDLSGWNLTNCQVLGGVFQGCTGLTSVNLSGWSTPAATDINEMFAGCTALTSLDLSSFDVSHVYTTGQMFENCSALSNLNISGWRTTSALQDSSRMFSGCSSLPTVDVSGFDVSRDNDVSYMFNGCAALNNIDVSGWQGIPSNAQNMFAGCTSLTSVSMPLYNAGLENATHMFDGDTALQSVDIRAFMSMANHDKTDMFAGCSSLDSVTVGPQWTFQGPSAAESAVLPTPPTGASAADPSVIYTGKWAKDSATSSTQLTPTELAGDYSPYTDGVHTWLWGENADYTLIYNANGGSGAPDNDTSESNIDPSDTDGLYWTISSTIPTRDGYNFTGWNTAADGSGDTYHAGDHMSLPTDSVTATLYAQWEPLSNYVLSYDPNGGTGTPAATTPVSPDTFWIVTSDQPTRDGYTFAGWNTEADGSGTAYAAGDHMALPADALTATLYAQWNENPTPPAPSEGGNGSGSGAGEPGSSLPGAGAGLAGLAGSGSGSNPLSVLLNMITGGAAGDNAAAAGTNATPATGDMLLRALPILLIIVAVAAGIIAYAAHKSHSNQGSHTGEHTRK